MSHNKELYTSELMGSLGGAKGFRASERRWCAGVSSFKRFCVPRTSRIWVVLYIGVPFRILSKGAIL